MICEFCNNRQNKNVKCAGHKTLDACEGFENYCCKCYAFQHNPPGYMHVYGQSSYHDHAMIVGDKTSLQKLRDAIDFSLKKQAASIDVEAADGEGYRLVVSCMNDGWDDLVRPYFADHAQDPRKDAIRPEALPKCLELIRNGYFCQDPEEEH